VSKGIGVVTCVYVHPDTDQFWLIDYRIYDPEGDGKSKLDHVREMLTNVVYQKQLPVQAVLMDTWYATKDFMLFIESLSQIYYCPLKDNRQVDDSGSQQPYRRVDTLAWNAQDLAHGKRIKIKGFPKDHKVHLFRVEVSTRRTDFVVTNDLTQDSTEATQEACGFRWKIEQLHREGKQVTGLERCQCRKARIQRNHIGCAFLGDCSKTPEFDMDRAGAPFYTTGPNVFSRGASDVWTGRIRARPYRGDCRCQGPPSTSTGM
jgi:hypothetical protein